MIRIRHLSMLALCLLSFWSCSKDDDLGVSAPITGGGAGGKNEIEFKLTIGSDLSTRKTTGIDLRSRFDPSDAVGLFAVKRNASATGKLQSANNYIHNVKLTCQADGTWKTDPGKEIYYPGGDEVLDIYAYYPYDATITNPTKFAFKIQTDQRDTKDFAKSDLMTAQVKGVRQGSINLKFEHRMAMVQIKEKDISIIFDSDKDYTCNIKVKYKGVEVNLSTDKVTSGVYNNDKVVMHRVPGYPDTYRALVPAQSIQGNTQLFSFERTSGKRKYKVGDFYPMPDSYTFPSSSDMVSLIAGCVELYYKQFQLNMLNYTSFKGIVFYTKGGEGLIFSLNQSSKYCWSTKKESTKATSSSGITNMKEIMSRKNWKDNYPGFAWVHSLNPSNTNYNNPQAKDIWFVPSKEEFASYTAGIDTYFIDDKIRSIGGSNRIGVAAWTSTQKDKSEAYWIIRLSTIDNEPKSNEERFLPMQRVITN